MACNIATLAEESTCFSGFSDRQLLQVAVAIVCNIEEGTPLACDVETLADEATCLSGASDRQLFQFLVSKLCDIGSGGGGQAQVFSGNYGGGVPTDVPTTSSAIAYDLDAPGDVWYWDGAAWT